MHDCRAWMALALTILKIVELALEMAKARRDNDEPPQQS